MTDEHNDEALLLMRVASVATRRRMLEDDLAKCRLTSRTLALELFFDYGYSIRKLERLTGHHRPTLRSWIHVAQADGRKLTPEQEADL